MNACTVGVLFLGLVCLDLLGVLVCVLAEMRHRGKGMHGTHDCGMGISGVDSGGGDGVP